MRGVFDGDCSGLLNSQPGSEESKFLSKLIMTRAQSGQKPTLFPCKTTGERHLSQVYQVAFSLMLCSCLRFSLHVVFSASGEVMARCHLNDYSSRGSLYAYRSVFPHR